MTPQNNATDYPPLSSLSRGGGCGCKIPPRILSQLLATSTFSDLNFPALLTSSKDCEDAAVWQYTDGSLLMATTDFFTPIVDNAYDFGQIAAANALSDIYAMGGQPLFALNLLAMPLDKVSRETIGLILEGGATICATANIPIVGGHSINTSEPIYGLTVIGRATVENARHNSDAKAGDALILGKPLGTGIITTAIKNDTLDPESYQEMLSHTTQLNRIGTDLGALHQVHAMTDVTGFGLLGHLSEMCRGANLAAKLKVSQVPLMRAAVALARKHVVSGASERNLEGLNLSGGNAIARWQLNLLSDPQTNGGLLVACDPAISNEVIALFHANEFGHAAVIGEFHHGSGIHLHP